MTEYEMAKTLALDFAVPEDDALKALRMEAEDLISDAQAQRTPYSQLRRADTGYKHAIEIAYEHIRGWLDKGYEFRLELSWQSVSGFALTHRRACLWAVAQSKWAQDALMQIQMDQRSKRKQDHDGVSGQDRKSYSDTQDRKSYKPSTD